MTSKPVVHAAATTWRVPRRCSHAFRDGRRDEFTGGLAETRSLCESVAWRALVREGMPAMKSNRPKIKEIIPKAAVPWKRVLWVRQVMKERLVRMCKDAKNYAAADDPALSALGNDYLRAKAALAMDESSFRLLVVDDLPPGMEFPTGRQGPLTSSQQENRQKPL